MSFLSGIGYRPQILDSLRTYSRAKFLADLASGLTVGVIALPLAMGFGIASGVKPEQGILTAIIAGFIISALGGCRLQIGGPTGAFVGIVYGIVHDYGYPNLVLCTLMAGVILLALGMFHLGNLVRFIPFPVTTGFTSGIAVVIALTQVPEFFGLSIDKISPEFLLKLQQIGGAFSSLSWPTTVLGLGALVFLFVWPRYITNKFPGSIIVLLIGTFIAQYFHLHVATIETQFHGISNSWPSLAIPDLSPDHLRHLASPALTIAILAAIESLLSATVADGLTGDRHDSNTELIAQGMANIFSPLFGGIPATGAIARTSANIQLGAQTPISGLIHSVTLLIIMMVAAPLAKYIPLCLLSAVLFMVAYNMGEWSEFARIRKIPKSDALVFLSTFILTVVFDLTLAVEVGLMTAAILFIRRSSETTFIREVTVENEQEGVHNSILGKEIPAGVLVYQIYGSLFFGAARKMEEALSSMGRLPKVLILRLQHVTVMDATALNTMEMIAESLHKHHCHLILSGPHTQPLAMLTNAGFIDKLGKHCVAAHLDDALELARDMVSA